MGKPTASIFKDFDLFARPVHSLFTLKGSHASSTYVGASCSFLAVVLMAFYVAFKATLVLGDFKDHVAMSRTWLQPDENYELVFQELPFFLEVRSIDNKGTVKSLSATSLSKLLNLEVLSQSQEAGAVVSETNLGARAGSCSVQFEGPVQNHIDRAASPICFKGSDLQLVNSEVIHRKAQKLELRMSIKEDETEPSDEGTSSGSTSPSGSSSSEETSPSASGAEVAEVEKQICPDGEVCSLLIKIYGFSPIYSTDDQDVSYGSKQLAALALDLSESSASSASSVIPKVYIDVALNTAEDDLEFGSIDSFMTGKEFRPTSQTIASISMSLGQEKISHRHMTYDFWDFIGDIGGVFQVILFVMGIFVMPLSEQTLITRAMKMLYFVRTRDTGLVRDSSLNPHTGKNFKKRVRFDLSDESEDHVHLSRLELDKKRAILLKPRAKCKIYWRNFWGCGTAPEDIPASSGDLRLVKLYSKGVRKLKEDFDLSALHRTLHDLKIMFQFIRRKQSDVMIDINSSKQNIINLENDDWELETNYPYRPQLSESKEVVSEEEEDLDDVDAISDEYSDTSKSRPSESRQSAKESSVASRSDSSSRRDKSSKRDGSSDESSEDDDSDSDEEENSVTEEVAAKKKMVAPADIDADFGDISDSGEGEKVEAMQSSNIGPISFDRKNDNVTQGEFKKQTQKFLAKREAAREDESKSRSHVGDQSPKIDDSDYGSSDDSSSDRTPIQSPSKKSSQSYNKSRSESESIGGKIRSNIMTKTRQNTLNEKIERPVGPNNPRDTTDSEQVVFRAQEPSTPIQNEKVFASLHAKKQSKEEPEHVQPPAYRFSFASKENEDQYNAQQRYLGQQDSNGTPPDPNSVPRNSLGPRESVDMMKMIQKTKDYLGPSASSAYGLQNKKKKVPKERKLPPQIPEESQDGETEYDIDQYRQRTGSQKQFKNEMQMRQTVQPEAYRQINRHETIQSILRQNQLGRGGPQV